MKRKVDFLVLKLRDLDRAQTRLHCFENREIVIGIIAIVALLIITIALNVSGFFPSGTAVPPQACAERAVAYINTNLPPSTGGPATLISVRQQHDTYEITLLYNGRNTTVYTAKDMPSSSQNPMP